MLWVDIDKDSTRIQTNILLGIVYRRPGANPAEFNAKLQDTLTLAQSERKEVIHLGDYNLNLLNSNTHPPTSEFIDINFTQSLFPSISKPTRITNRSATLIDSIFTTLPFMTNSKSGILMWDISDHFPVFFIKYINSSPNIEPYRLSRSHCASNKLVFSRLMTNTNWDPVTSENDTQAAYSNFHQIITRHFL
jgi:hypothetical protein